MSINLLDGDKYVIVNFYEMIDSVSNGRTRMHLFR